MGDKYGWKTFPAIITEAEMLGLIPQLDDQERKSIRTWYKIDNNAVPAEFVLKPRTNEFREYCQLTVQTTKF